jgi:hypothetical protein
MRTATKCDYCGDYISPIKLERGEYASCSNPSCSREAARDERDDARAEYEYAREAAEADNYGRYRGW